MIYLNNASTTKIYSCVLEDFIWCAKNFWHNPSDVSQKSIDAKNIIRNAQEKIATAINADSDEIIFTSGGSESNNWAIKGYLDRYPGVKAIITTEIEHPSVYNTCKYMESKGYQVYYAPIDSDGLVDVVKLENLISENNLLFSLVSIMMANNEIGTVNNIAAISTIVHRYGCTLHVDAVQAFMHMPIDVKKMGIDMMSVSFHKFGGFKNCGFLYLKSDIELTPLIHGGKQFDFKRSGTENVPMIYAMGNQVEELSKDLDYYMNKISEIYDYTIQKIYTRCKDLCSVWLNGHPEKRIKNNLSFTFKGIGAESLITLLELKGIYVSAGSACCSGEKIPSRVLRSIGLHDEEAFSTIRISINYNTTKKEIDEFVDYLVECIENLKFLN